MIPEVRIEEIGVANVPCGTEIFSVAAAEIYSLSGFPHSVSY